MQSLKLDILQVFQETLNLPDLQIWIESTTTHHRQELRRSLLKFLEKHHIPHDLHAILNLEELPRLPKGDVSLSHCQKQQGFAYTSESVKLGFDIEWPDRIKQSVVARISTPEEVQSCSNLAMLWVGKEAAFKSFSKSHGADLLSQVHLSQWIPLKSDVYVVSARYLENHSTGVVASASSCFYGVFKS